MYTFIFSLQITYYIRPARPSLRTDDAKKKKKKTACIDGSTDCVRRLLSAGASPVPPDAWGRDPAAVARQLGRAGPLRLLEDAAARSKTGGNSMRGGGRASPPAVTRPSAGGDGDASDGEREAGNIGSAPEGEGGGGRGTVPVAGGPLRGALSGNRWVVMNEGGRMLERASGKVRC